MPFVWLIAVLTKEVIKEIILARMKSFAYNWWVVEKSHPAITYNDPSPAELNEVDCLFNEEEDHNKVS